MTLPDFIVTVTDPGCGWLTSNQREHYRPRAHRTALWREAGAWAAKRAELPLYERAHVVAFLRFHDQRRRDALNWWPTVKAAIDGICSDAGRLVPDDDSEHLIGPDLRVGPTLARGERLRVDLHIYANPEGTP